MRAPLFAIVVAMLLIGTPLLAGQRAANPRQPSSGSGDSRQAEPRRAVPRSEPATRARRPQAQPPRIETRAPRETAQPARRQAGSRQQDRQRDQPGIRTGQRNIPATRQAVPRTGRIVTRQPLPPSRVTYYYYRGRPYPYYPFGTAGLNIYYGPYGWYPPHYTQVRGYYQLPYGSRYGELRLKVRPRSAEVYVDGYYAGIVDSFDGLFQSLKLEPGPHRIEILAPGYNVLEFEIQSLRGNKITFEGELVYSDWN